MVHIEGYPHLRDILGGSLQQIRAGKFDIFCAMYSEEKCTRTVVGVPIKGTFVIMGFSPQGLVGLNLNEATWLLKDLRHGLV